MGDLHTDPRTGGQKGTKPERHSLIPRAGLDAIARVFAYGDTQYPPHNWRKGYDWDLSYDALIRHLTAYWSGETYDADSGQPHLAHAGFHIFTLLTWLEEQGEGGEFDTRYVPRHRADEKFLETGSYEPPIVSEPPNRIYEEIWRDEIRRQGVGPDLLRKRAGYYSPSSPHYWEKQISINEPGFTKPALAHFSVNRDGTVTDNTRARLAEVGRIVHNHDYDPSCRETVVDNWLRGECLIGHPGMSRGL